MHRTKVKLYFIDHDVDEAVNHTIISVSHDDKHKLDKAVLQEHANYFLDHKPLFSCVDEWIEFLESLGYLAEEAKYDIEIDLTGLNTC